ncbi:hypothetical protein DMENIID0001_042740 [Sergentomyia squamirostris]
MKILFVFLTFIFVASQQTKCPEVIPMENFDIDRFLGTWYVIQQTQTPSRCVQHQITPLENPGEYRISQVSPHYLLDKLLLQHEHTYTGFLKADLDLPGKLKAHYALSFGDEAYVIVTTDYDNYAGVITCGARGDSRIATILSRTQSLPEFNLDEIRTKIDSFGVKISDISTISHKNCPRDGVKGFNIKIPHDLLTPEGFTKGAQGVVKNIESAIGDFFGGILNRKSRRV